MSISRFLRMLAISHFTPTFLPFSRCDVSCFSGSHFISIIYHILRLSCIFRFSYLISLPLATSLPFLALSLNLCFSINIRPSSRSTKLSLYWQTIPFPSTAFLQLLTKSLLFLEMSSNERPNQTSRQSARMSSLTSLMFAPPTQSIM